MSVREKLECLQGMLVGHQDRTVLLTTINGAHSLVTEILDELSVERDHEAMEELRRASLKRGWQWKWDGLYELSQTTETSESTYKDPADALLMSGKIQPSESTELKEKKDERM